MEPSHPHCLSSLLGDESDSWDQRQLIFPRKDLTSQLLLHLSLVSIQEELGGGLPRLLTIHRVILAILNFLSKVTWCLAFQSQDQFLYSVVAQACNLPLQLKFCHYLWSALLQWPSPFSFIYSLPRLHLGSCCHRELLPHWNNRFQLPSVPFSRLPHSPSQTLF